MVLLLILLALLVLVGGVAAIVLVIGRHQKQSIAFDNQIVPGMPSNAPASWAGSHDPEARLHRRLRDAIRALHGVNAYDTASSVNLRAGLEQSAMAIDNHLIAVATLPRPHRDQALPDATAAVEAVEAGVAQYVSATTKPDPVAFEAGLQGVQTSIDAITQNLGALGPGLSASGIYPGQFGMQAPAPVPQQQPGATPLSGQHPPQTGGYPQAQPNVAQSGGYPPQTGGGYAQAQPNTPESGGYPAQSGSEYPQAQPNHAQPGGYPPAQGGVQPQPAQPGGTTPPDTGTGASDPTIIRRQP
ncbi:hypothetical protein NRB20_03810 [Nocardia sp. RB20]|uniref:Uncharacterized protein n=1 Tax=Nocardia macrotermitis TaxID=2585198 RepID=A0A7K0CV49_9NOCA|nr:hypothetical protein [Nocardia macrotermitis]